MSLRSEHLVRRDRDAAIYWRYLAGARQASLSREFKLSPSRIGAIVKRYTEYRRRICRELEVRVLSEIFPRPTAIGIVLDDEHLRGKSRWVFINDRPLLRSIRRVEDANAEWDLYLGMSGIRTGA